MSEDWLKIVKEKMDSYETPVPEEVWERVEASVFPEKTRKVRFMPWVWSAVAAAVVALGVFAGLRLMDNNGGRGTDDNNFVAENQVSSEINSSSSVMDGGDQVSSAPEEPIHLVPAPSRSALAVVSPVIPEDNAEPQVSEDVEIVNVPPAGPEQVKPQDDKNDSGFKTDHDGEDWSDYMSATGEGRRSGKRTPSAGFSLTSAASTAQTINTMDTKPFFLGYASNLDMGTRNDATIYTKTTSIPVKKDEEHNRPIRMSLSVDIPLTGALSLESGLTYSILRSTFTTSSGTRVSEDKQTLGYLGVPLNLKADLWRNDLFTVYGIGGGMVEKCVNAVANTYTTVGGEKNGTTKLQFNVKPLAWSVNASAGFQVNIPGSLGIYAEPGISYHFPDNTKVRSIYTEKPFDFVLSFGVRYSFR